MPLTENEIDILETIRTGNGLTVTEIMKNAHINDERRSTVQQALTRLEKQGWIERDREPREHTFTIRGQFKTTPLGGLVGFDQRR